MTLQWIYTISTILLAGALLLFGRVAFGLFSGFDAEHQLTVADNPAVGTALFGFLGGLIIVLAALLNTPSGYESDPVSLAWDLGELGLYGFLTIALLKLSGYLNEKLILYRFDARKELIQDRNIGTGAVLCGGYLASGLVLAGALSGQVSPAALPEDVTPIQTVMHELVLGILFYGLAQIVLIVFGQIYRRILPVDLHDAISRDYVKDGIKYGGNLAAGISFGGNLAAIGLILYGASHADFFSWQNSLTTFGVTAGVGLVLLPLWRLFIQHVLMGKANLAHEIFEDRNTNAALMETIAVIGLAAVLAITLP